MRTHRFLMASLGAALVSTLVLSCSTDPEVTKRRYFEDGERYFAQQKYPEAIIQYRNAIQIDPRYGMARYKLAHAYEATNDPLNALKEYVRAADLLPDNAEAQLRAGSMLALAHQYEDARARAAKVLAKDPKNLDARILEANAMAGMKDLDGAVEQMTEAVRLYPNQERTYISLGRLEASRGNQPQAEAAFKKAIDIAPKSIDTHLALAEYYATTRRYPEAEAELKRGLAVDPKSLVANRALAMFYRATNRGPEAEAYLIKLTELSDDPTFKFGLADYYVFAQRREDAVRVLNKAASDPKAASAAQVRLAGVKYLSKDPAAAYAALEEVLKREPKNVPALMLKARLLLQDRKPNEALAPAQDAVAANPNLAEAKHVLGLVYSALNDREKALTAFSEAAKLDPGSDYASQAQLAKLYLAAGDVERAMEAAEKAVKNPIPDVDAQLTYVRLLIFRGQTERADTELKALEQQYPKMPTVPTLAGSLYMRKNDRASARRSFERALALDPGSVEALTGLVTLDLEAGDARAAQAAVDAAAQKLPKNAAVQLVAAKVYSRQGNAAKEEAALRKAIEIDPSNLTAYMSLGQLLYRQHKLDAAQREFAQITSRDPNNVPAQTMSGILLELANKPAEAQKQYERVMQIDANAAVAANNLAWLYAEHGGNLDVALQLAQTAKGRLPDRPEINDTLGWLYYKKGLVSLAVPPFQQSVSADPRNPLYHYHLGLAYAKLGDKPKAKASLEQALKLNPNFTESADARRVLAQVGT